MSYQALYRRYRPRRFADVRGQEHVVLALRTAVAEDRVGHAYLFSGPRGTGKTTSARILAKVLNCTNPQDGEPCCECDSCKSVEAGTSFDVHELDAASNNGVDNVRDLIDKANLGTPGRRKVYILDEVHMLSKQAEAALLKTLEEPPPHVVFVLATTDPQKVSETIRSRCQKMPFHLIASTTLVDHLRWLGVDAGLNLTEEQIEAAIEAGGGSARDALSALETLIAGGGSVEEGDAVGDLIAALIDREAGKAVAAVAMATSSGRDARTLAEQVVARLRDCLLSELAPDEVRLPDRARARVADQARQLGVPAITRAMSVLGEVLLELRQAPDPRLLLDVAMVRLTRVEADVSPAALMARIEKLEAALASGVVSPAAVPASSVAPAQPAPRPVGERAKLGERVQRAPASVAAARPIAEPAPAAPAPVPVPPPVAAAAPTSVGSRALSMNELVGAWPELLTRVKGLARAIYAPGRFVAVNGTRARFAVPSTTPLHRVEEHRPTIEGALSAHFGQAITIEVIRDADGDGPDANGGRGGPPPPSPDEPFDPSDLIDAPPVTAINPVDRLVQAFPGAKLVADSE